MTSEKRNELLKMINNEGYYAEISFRSSFFAAKNLVDFIYPCLGKPQGDYLLVLRLLFLSLKYSHVYTVSPLTTS